eukprot:scaffold306_cov525-Prasinococcus_capsulatus_cf.AAC.64
MAPRSARSRQRAALAMAIVHFRVLLPQLANSVIELPLELLHQHTQARSLRRPRTRQAVSDASVSPLTCRTSLRLSADKSVPTHLFQHCAGYGHDFPQACPVARCLSLVDLAAEGDGRNGHGTRRGLVHRPSEVSSAPLEAPGTSHPQRPVRRARPASMTGKITTAAGSSTEEACATFFRMSTSYREKPRREHGMTAMSVVTNQALSGFLKK